MNAETTLDDPRMGAWLKALAYGCLAGVLLGAVQPAGAFDLLGPFRLGLYTDGIVRLLVFLAISLPLDLSLVAFSRSSEGSRQLFQRRLPSASMLFAAALGYLVEGFLVAPYFKPTDRVQVVLTIVLVTFVLFRLAGRRSPALPPSDRFLKAAPALVGAGSALIGCELFGALALLSGGSPLENSITGAIGLVWVGIGALLVGSAVKRLIPESVTLWLFAALPVTGIVTLRLHEGLDGTTLTVFLERFRLGTDRIGSLPATAVFASMTFLVPGLALGFLIGGFRRGTTLGRYLWGVAFGAGAAMLVQVAPVEANDDFALPGYCLLGGTLACSLGAVLATWSWSRLPSITGILVALAAAFFFIRAQPEIALRFSPWLETGSTRRITLERVWRTRHGVMTVERLDGGPPMVTLNRKRLSPLSPEWRVDRLRIDLVREFHASIATATKVLFVGVWTPERERAFQAWSGVEVDRTAPWGELQDPVSAELFDQPSAVPATRFETARKKLLAGEYDVVLVAPVHGAGAIDDAGFFWSAPPGGSVGSHFFPEGTIVVVWSEAGAEPTVRQGERLLVATDALRYPSIGRILFNREPRPLTDPGTVNFPPPARGPLLDHWIDAWDQPGSVAERRTKRTFRRLADVAAAERWEPAARGLELHYAAQPARSPASNAESLVHLSERSLRPWMDHTRACETPPLFLRELWNGVSWTLTLQRREDWIQRYVEPLVDDGLDWPELELALAAAHWEHGEARPAWERLEEALARWPDEVALRHATARAAAASGAMARARELEPELQAEHGPLRLPRWPIAGSNGP